MSVTEPAECRAYRPERGDDECSGPVDRAVTYRRTSGAYRGRLTDYAPACALHAAVEAARAAASGVMASVAIEPLDAIRREAGDA